MSRQSRRARGGSRVPHPRPRFRRGRRVRPTHRAGGRPGGVRRRTAGPYAEALPSSRPLGCWCRWSRCSARSSTTPRAGPRQDQRHGDGAADRARRPAGAARVHWTGASCGRGTPRPGRCPSTARLAARSAIQERRRGAGRRRRRAGHARGRGRRPAGLAAGWTLARVGERSRLDCDRRRNDPVTSGVDRSVPFAREAEPIHKRRLSTLTSPTRIDRRQHSAQVVGSGPEGHGRTAYAARAAAALGDASGRRVATGFRL